MWFIEEYHEGKWILREEGPWKSRGLARHFADNDCESPFRVIRRTMPDRILDWCLMMFEERPGTVDFMTHRLLEVHTGKRIGSAFEVQALYMIIMRSLNNGNLDQR